jgi:hypothetical protein
MWKHVVGNKPKPRALLQELEDPIAEQVGSLFPTWRPIESLAEVSQDESDVLVTTKALGLNASRHLYVVGMGCHDDPPTGAAAFGLCNVSFGQGSWFQVSWHFSSAWSRKERTMTSVTPVR